MPSDTLTFRLPKVNADQIRAQAAAKGVSLNQHLAYIAETYLNGTANPPPPADVYRPYAEALQDWCKQTIRMAKNTGAVGLLSSLPELPAPPSHA